MATEGGGKIKPKRQHVDSRPYDPRQSLLGRMKDTVKDMLSPSWVIDLVNGVRKTPSSNVEQQQEHGSQPTHYQPPDGEVPVRRELNRMGNEENIMMSLHMSQSRSNIPTNQPAAQVPGYSTPQMPCATYRPPAPIPQHIMTNGDDQPEPPNFTGPGPLCSNMMLLDRKDYQNEMLHLNESRIRQMQQQMELHSESMSTQHNPSNDSTNTSTDGSFLWSSSKTGSSRPQPPAKGQNPSFNITAFNSSLSNPKDPSFRKSPYYPGKTTFGGATSHRKSRLNSSLPYESSPLRKEVRARPLNNSALGGVTSSTAKRILDTLEKMSSPLSDAKRIPYNANLSDSLLSRTPSTFRQRPNPHASMSQKTSFCENTPSGPPVSQMTMPSFASIATNRQTYPMPMPAQQRSPSKPPSQVEEPVNRMSSTEKSNMRSGKMKRDRGTHYSSKAEEPEIEVPDLPTNFTLPVSNFTLPKFDFGVPKSNDDHGKGFDNSSEMSSPKASPMTFTFSSPIVETNHGVSSPSHSNSQNFKFSSPLSIEANGNGKHIGSNYSPKLHREPEMNFKASVEKSGLKYKASSQPTVDHTEDMQDIQSSSEPKKGSLTDILANKSPSVNGSVSGGIAPASSLKSGSVMDILGKSSGTTTGRSLTDVFKKLEGEWTCDICLVKNKPQASKCVACETAKSQPESTKSNSTKTTTHGDWICQTCLVKNFSNRNKCIACQTTKTQAESSARQGTSSLNTVFKKPEGEWTCDTCLVNNKSDAFKCIACETPKPRPKSFSPPEDTSLGQLFQKVDGEWTCSVCLVQNKANLVRCAACETPKVPALGSSRTLRTSDDAGEWTCDTCLVRNKPSVSSCIACTTAKPGVKLTSAVNAQSDSKAPIGFGNLAKKPTGNWECDTCLVSNKPEANKCIACETPKPGSKPATGFTNTGGFKFPASGGFSFGTIGNTSNTSTSTTKTGSNCGESTSLSSGEAKLPTLSFAAPKDGFSFGSLVDKKSDSKTDKPATLPPIQPKAGVSETNATPLVAVSKPVFGNFGQKAEASENKIGTSSPLSRTSMTSPSLNSVKSTDAEKNTGGFQIPAIGSDPPAPKSVPAPTSGFTFGKPNRIDSVSNSSPFQFGQPLSQDINKNDSKPLGVGGFTTSLSGNDTNVSPVFAFSAKTQDPASKKTSSSDLGDAKGVENTPSAVFGAGTDAGKTLPTSGFKFGNGSTSSAPAGMVFGSNEKKVAGTAAPTFTFGASADSTNAGSNFAFKATGGNTLQSSTNKTFSFDASSKNNSPSKRIRDDMEGTSEAKKASFSFTGSKDTTFKFGEKAPSNTNSVPDTGFAFGSSSTPSFGTPKIDNPTAGFAGFSGGSTQSAGSVFGAPAPSNAPVFGGSSSTFGLGARSVTPSFGTPKTQQSGGINLTTPSSFSFGSAATPAAGLFQFSAGNNSAVTSNSSSGAGAGFQFDQNAASVQPVAPAPAPAAAPTPSFNASPAINFTGQPQTSGMFNFGAAAPPVDNPFSATGGGNAGPRRYKKAVRKLRK